MFILSVIDFLHNSTFAGNLCVDPVLESVTEFEYAAGRGSVSPTNSSAKANYAGSLMNIREFGIRICQFLSNRHCKRTYVSVAIHEACHIDCFVNLRSSRNDVL